MFTLRTLSQLIAVGALALTTAGARAQGYSPYFGSPFGGYYNPGFGTFGGGYFGNGFGLNYFGNGSGNGGFGSGYFSVSPNAYIHGGPVVTIPWNTGPVAVSPNGIEPAPNAVIVDPTITPAEQAEGIERTQTAPDQNPGDGTVTRQNETPSAGGSETIELRREANGTRIRMGWNGDPAQVRSVTFALLDRSKNTILQRTIRRTPVEVRMALPRRAAYYQVTTQYLDGTSRTITTSL